MSSRVSPAVKAQAIRMRENGASVRAIANALGLSKGTISHWFTPGAREKQRARDRVRSARTRAANPVPKLKARRTRTLTPPKPKPKPKPKPRVRPERKAPPRLAADVSPILAMRIEERVRARLEGS